MVEGYWLGTIHASLRGSSPTGLFRFSCRWASSASIAASEWIVSRSKNKETWVANSACPSFHARWTCQLLWVGGTGAIAAASLSARKARNA